VQAWVLVVGETVVQEAPAWRAAVQGAHAVSLQEQW